MAKTDLSFKTDIDTKSWNMKVKGMRKSIRGVGKDASTLKSAFASFVGNTASMGFGFAVRGLQSATYGAIGAVKELYATYQDQVRSEALVKKSFESTGLAYERYKDRVGNFAKDLQKSIYIDDDDIKKVFAMLMNGTGDVNKAFKYTGLALDLAAKYNMNYAKSARNVALALGGETRALRQLGIVVPKEMKTREQKAAYAIQRMEGIASGEAKRIAEENPQVQVADLWERIKDDMAEVFGPEIKEALKEIVKQLETMDTAELVNAAKETGAAIVEIAKSMPSIVEGVAKIAGKSATTPKKWKKWAGYLDEHMKEANIWKDIYHNYDAKGFGEQQAIDDAYGDSKVRKYMPYLPTLYNDSDVGNALTWGHDREEERRIAQDPNDQRHLAERKLKEAKYRKDLGISADDWQWLEDNGHANLYDELVHGEKWELKHPRINFNAMLAEARNHNKAQQDAAKNAALYSNPNAFMNQQKQTIIKIYQDHALRIRKAQA